SPGGDEPASQSQSMLLLRARRPGPPPGDRRDPPLLTRASAAALRKAQRKPRSFPSRIAASRSILLTIATLPRPQQPTSSSAALSGGSTASGEGLLSRNEAGIGSGLRAWTRSFHDPQAAS